MMMMIIIIIIIIIANGRWRRKQEVAVEWLELLHRSQVVLSSNLGL
jgi:hypothetical protein